MNRVAISSMGIVSPIGTGKNEFFDGLTKGLSGAGIISNFQTRYYPIALGAEARILGTVIPSDENGDRRELFNNLAFDELLLHSPLDRYAPKQRMLIAGCSLDFFWLQAYAHSEDFKNHCWQKYSNDSCAMFSRYADKFDIKGGVIINASACVASSQAIGLGFRALKADTTKAIIAGGVDSMLNPLHYMGFYKLGALSDWKGDPREACRPFDRDRCGVVLGEGAAFYLLENEESCRKDCALAYIVGYASTVDSYLITDPDPDGKFLAKAAIEAIAEAGITPDKIDCVHAHGTGTLKNDRAECNAIRLIFGSRYREVPVFSLKAQVGHLIGACGALEIGAALYSFEKQIVPATKNFSTPDPEIDLKVLKNPLQRPINYILKLNAAFGGQNTAIVMQRAEVHG